MMPVGMTRCLMALAGISALRVLADEVPVRGQPETEWAKIEAATGAMLLDGTLRCSFPLGSSRDLTRLGLRLELEHRIETDERGKARSAWRIKGLQTCLMPSGWEHLRWQPPAGQTQLFERKKIGRALANAGPARWLIRESAPGQHEIRSQDGWAWRYAQGTLAAIEHPHLGSLRVSTQGAWITRIAQAGAPAGQPALLQARYSDGGRLRMLQLEKENAQELTWNDAGELVVWRRADGREVRWNYEAHLLGGIIEPDQPPRAIRWRENPGYGRGDSRWPAPVHLAAAGADEYDYRLTSRGFILGRKEGGTGAKTITLFNPRRHRLEQQINGRRFIVKFRKQSHSRGALERIETGDGKVLEEYSYDESGRLVGVKQAGKPLMNLDYDDIGRLIGIKEETTP